MSSWNARAEPAPCRGLGRLALGLHLGAALVPWLAGCSPWLAVALSAACLLALPTLLAALPGRLCEVTSLGYRDGQWSARLADGRQVQADIEGATRVFSGLVVCRLSAANRRYDWWLPRYAVPAGDFRRLKVALRCTRHCQARPGC